MLFKELELESVRLVEGPGVSVVLVARNLDLNENLLIKRRRLYSAVPVTEYPDTGPPRSGCMCPW